MNVLKPHVSLNVTNIDASVAFYEKVCGVQATKRRPGYAKFDLLAPSLNLSMVEAPRSGVNASHFGIQVASTDDVVLATERFKPSGLRAAAEENTACCTAMAGAAADPDLDQSGVRAAAGHRRWLGNHGGGAGAPQRRARAPRQHHRHGGRFGGPHHHLRADLGRALQ